MADFCAGVYWHSSVKSRRVPSRTPDAPRVSSEATCAPVAIPPAAMTGGPLGMASRMAVRRMEIGGAWMLLCPPASLPESYLQNMKRHTDNPTYLEQR